MWLINITSCKFSKLDIAAKKHSVSFPNQLPDQSLNPSEMLASTNQHFPTVGETTDGLLLMDTLSFCCFLGVKMLN